MIKVPEAGLWFYLASAEETCPLQADGEILLRFDAKKAANGMLLRSRRPGDCYIPRGFSGRRRVKELMIDAKIPRRKRDSIPILEIDGKIAWIMGFRPAQEFAAESDGVKLQRLVFGKIEEKRND